MHCGREVDQYVRRNAGARVGRGPGGEGLGRRIPLARYVALRHRSLDDGPDRLSGYTVKDVEISLFGGQRHGLYGLAGNGDVHQQRRRREVVVPDLVMDGLEVPFHLAGLEVNRHQALPYKPVAGPLTAIEVRRRRFNRQVGEAGFRIGGHFGPDAGVAGVFRRAFEPGVVAGLTLLRNGVKFPELPAGTHVVGARRALVVAITRRRETFPERRADQHHVAGHGRRRLPADFAGNQVGLDLLIIVRLQVDGAVVAEGADALPGLGVQRDQQVARRYVEDARIFTVAPIDQASPGNCLGAAAPRAPSCSPCTQSSSPVTASRAITPRREPAVV